MELRPWPSRGFWVKSVQVSRRYSARMKELLPPSRRSLNSRAESTAGRQGRLSVRETVPLRVRLRRVCPAAPVMRRRTSAASWEMVKAHWERGPS